MRRNEEVDQSSEDLEDLTLVERSMYERITKEIKVMADIMSEAHFQFSRSRHIDEDLPDMGEIEFMARCAKIWNIYLVLEPEFDMLRRVRMGMREEWMEGYHEDWQNKYGGERRERA